MKLDAAVPAISEGHRKPFQKTQFCPRGHDKDVVGRDKRGSCRICSNRKSNALKRKKHIPTERRTDAFAPHVPFAPLEAALKRRGLSLSAFDENTTRVLARAKANGTITVHMADEVSCAIGIHPANLFGNAFYADRMTAEDRKRHAYETWWFRALNAQPSPGLTEEVTV